MEREKKIKPFTHDNLELKQGFLKYARDLKGKQGFENGLAAAVIYASFAEYIAENLLENLRHLIFTSSFNQYAGIVYKTSQDKKQKRRTLGESIHELESYSFPDRDGIIGCLKKINKARNEIFHELASSDQKVAERLLTENVFITWEETEELVNKIDMIYEGLRKIIAPTALEAKIPEQEKKNDPR